MTEQKWPNILWLIRHGESAGNVARDAAYSAGLGIIDIDVARDVDVPLSELGERQAQAVGQWFGKQREKPTVVLTSPYLRARHTTELLLHQAGLQIEDVTFVVDERLREREFGILDRLTRMGVQEHFPEQARIMSTLGKFYHRPPGGESWCDVILRLRSMLETIVREYPDENVLVVAHTVVVLCFRYLIERLDEEQILTIDRAQELANCSVTTYGFNPSVEKHGKLVLQAYNFVAPIEAAGEEVTSKPDTPVAAK